MSPLPGWHPLVVHFPLALILVAAALLLAARVLRSPSLAATAATVGTWNLCLGAVAALCALATGLAGVIDLDVGAAARQAISLHMKWALFTTLTLVLLAVWRGAGTAQESRPSWVFIVVLLAASAALAFTGYRGGKNVFEYGVGVKKKNRRAARRNTARRTSLPHCDLLRGHGSGVVRHHVGFQRAVRLRNSVHLDRFARRQVAREGGESTRGGDVDRADRQDAIG